MTGSAESRRPRRLRRVGAWLAVPLVALLVAVAVTYNTEQGQSWVDAMASRNSTDTDTDTGADTDENADTSTGPASGVSTTTLPTPTSPAPIADVADPTSPDTAKIETLWRKALAGPAVGKHVVAAVTSLSGPAGQEYRSGTGAVVPASTMKLLTSVAALETLGLEHTFETTVALEPSLPDRPLRTVVLVGGGDPLLSRKPDPAAFPQRADIRTLARQTAQSLSAEGVRRVLLRYDATLFNGPVGSAQWRPDYLADKIVSPITALWVDEGRPASGFGRVADPSLVAAQEFAVALRRAGVIVRGAPTPGSPAAQATQVASVSSPPLATIVEHVINVSDNEAAEVLAHQVGLTAAGEGSFEGGARGVATTLSGLGVPLEGAAIYDGSGLSRANRLTSDTLLSVLRVAAHPDHPQLRAVLTGLPVAGFTGSLASRFAEGPDVGRGQVRAKTGTLTGVHGLAGTVTDRDGQTYAFMIVADKVPLLKQLAARETIDRLAARLAACRCSS